MEKFGEKTLNDPLAYQMVNARRTIHFVFSSLKQAYADCHPKDVKEVDDALKRFIPNSVHR